MALTCPKCAAVLPTADINVATDVAMCRACGTMHKASELLSDDVVDQTQHEAATSLSGPQPPGISWRDDGQTLTIKTGIGSRAIAGFLGVFAAFWTIPCLLVGAEPIERLINGPPVVQPLPEGASEFERAQHEMIATRGVDFADFVMVAVLLGVAGLFWVLALTALRAKVRITVRPDMGIVKKGAFPFYSTKQFDPARVTAVVETIDESTKINGKNPTKILIKADEEISFGGFMPEARRKWVAAILQVNLLRRR